MRACGVVTCLSSSGKRDQAENVDERKDSNR